MKKPKITKKLLKRMVLPAIIFIQFALIAVLAWYVYWNRQDVNQQGTTKIETLINYAVDGLTWPTNVDAQTGRVYIREARLTLPPAPDHSYTLFYNYTPAFPGQGKEVRILDAQNIRREQNKILIAQDLNGVFSRVPKLQACARGYSILFSKSAQPDSGTTNVFNKTLADGRTIYVYLDNGCTDGSSAITPYLKQIQSY